MARLLLPGERLITPLKYTADNDCAFFHSFEWRESLYNLPGWNDQRAVQYLKETLIPTLHPGDIVVMDNLRSHHVKAVQEVLEAQGIQALYLPPYSPELNPIEKMWSKVKSLLRTWKIRSLELLPDAISKALTCVSAQDCQHWFAASDYC